MIRFLFALLLCAFAITANAQVSVSLQIKRRTFLRYEPVLATVAVTNLAGRPIKLEDGETQWFGFQINNGSTENLVPPRNPDYTLEALEIGAGETVKRTVNLNTLYGLDEFGVYRVKATIYSKELGKFFTSKADSLIISDGRVIWKQTVGVPNGYPNEGATHTISVLTYDDDTRRYLYARVEDEEKGRIFCTQRLGMLVEGNDPQMQLDTANNLYVLQLAAPKEYLLSKIGVNGEFIGQSHYSAPKAKPFLRRLADGTLQIVNGKREVAQANTSEVPTPKLSDRPAGIPLN